MPIVLESLRGIVQRLVQQIGSECAICPLRVVYERQVTWGHCLNYCPASTDARCPAHIGNKDVMI